MAKLLKLRRGTTANHGDFKGEEGEITVDTTKWIIRVHGDKDSNNAVIDGGRPLLREDLDNLAAGAIVHEKLATDCVDGDNIADNSIGTDHYVDDSIHHDHLKTDCIDDTNIQDNSIKEEHYTDGSIKEAHIADNQVTVAKLSNDSTKGITRGKIIYGNSSGEPAALSPGTNGQVLQSDGTDISWQNNSAGATGGNSNANRIFWENEQSVTHDYTIQNNHNAGSFGPITINASVTVTVGAGENWTII